jgi:hypothetical protein
MDMTKDTLLQEADALFAEARRARKLSAAQHPGTASEQLMRDAENLERRAMRLEKDAASARNGVFMAFDFNRLGVVSRKDRARIGADAARTFG